jgi:hypothetical protein
VNHRKKFENLDTQNKFLNKSMTLDEILDSQRSLDDKFGLGYNKEEISTPEKSDVGPSFLKGENRSNISPSFAKDEDRSDTTPSFAKSERRYDSGSSRSRNKSNSLQHLEDQIMEDIQNIFINLKASSEERHLHG